MFPIISISSPKLVGSRFCLAYTFGKTPFNEGFSFSITSIASSTVFPMVGCFAFDKRKFQRASVGTKNTFSALYSSLSSGSAPAYSPSPALSFSKCSSKASEIYFKNISPKTTCLYSAASIFFLSLSADFQSCFSKGSSVLLPFFIAILSPLFKLLLVCGCFEG